MAGRATPCAKQPARLLDRHASGSRSNIGHGVPPLAHLFVILAEGLLVLPAGRQSLPARHVSQSDDNDAGRLGLTRAQNVVGRCGHAAGGRARRHATGALALHLISVLMKAHQRYARIDSHSAALLKLSQIAAPALAGDGVDVPIGANEAAINLETPLVVM